MEKRDNMKKTSLMAASRQWAERPADQRFWTLQELLDRTKMYAEQCVVKPVPLGACEVITAGEDLRLAGPEGGEAEFMHYSFGQVASLAQAPASYLRTLPAQLAADNLNHGLMRLEGTQSLMFHKNGGLHLRCVTSDKYARIWNWEVAELALALQENDGWVTPPARPCGIAGVPVRKATQSDVLVKTAHPELGIRVGDDISPAGLYASDHDLFIFQVNEDAAIDAGDGETMYRGVFWRNSEVGECKWRGTFFLYDSVCGNHIVWGAKVLAEIAITHTGSARERFAEAMASVNSYICHAASEDEARIRAAKQKVIGAGKDDIVKLVFRPAIGLSKRECEDSYVLAVRHADSHGGDPHTAWGYAAGVTRLSQGKYADDRDRMDRAAGRIIEMAL